MKWEMIRADKFCCSVKDGTHDTPKPVSEGYKLVTSKHIIGGHVCSDDAYYISEYDYNKINERSLVEKWDVLMSMIGNGLGKTAIIDTTPDYAIKNIALFKIGDEIKARWLHYFLSSHYGQGLIYSKLQGSGQPFISLGFIRGFEIPNPDYSTMRQIVSVLSVYDSQIENNQKRIKLLEQMAENLYKEWFVRFRFPGYESSEFEGGIPKVWKIEKLKQFITFYRGKSYGSDDIASGDYVLLSMNNIRPWGGYIRDDSRVFGGAFKDFQLLHKGDLIMSITDMTQDRRIIGYVGIFDEERNDCVMSTHLMKVVSGYNNYYLYGLFNFSLSRSISEYATGANVLGLTDKILKEIKALVPSKELISAYGNAVKPIWEEIFYLKDEIANLTHQRDLLLPRLMSGKLSI